MALKALMLRKRISDLRTSLNDLKNVNFDVREAEIEKSIEEANTDEEKSAVEAAVEAFETEKADNESKKSELEREIGELENELEAIEKSDPNQKEERKVEKKMNIRSTKEYTEAFAKYVRTGKDTEVRALLSENVSGGTVPVPEFIEARVRTAWDKEGIMALVKKTYLRGNIKVGFEISATGAVVHTEGSAAPSEETLTLGIVSMVPETIKKWITISDEVLDLGS